MIMTYTFDEKLAAARELDHLYPRIAHAVPHYEWPELAPIVRDILELKRERNAIVLAHNYMPAPVYHLVADERGDSLQLAQLAAKSTAEVIVQAGVYFMAETSKILCPGRTVLIPDRLAGCSLASSITGKDVRAMRDLFPGVPVVVYVNTTAEVKAEADACCTSSNAVEVVESFGVDRVMLLPDKYLAQNVAARTKVDVIYWNGTCEVHEKFTPEQVDEVKRDYPEALILAHPECRLDVVAKADYAGSTSAMSAYIHAKKPSSAFLITECSMSSNIRSENPDTEFLGMCQLCPHMGRITLTKIRDSLISMSYQVQVDDYVARRARGSIQRMLDVTK